MDDPVAGDDRQHKSWRDLPPTPPLVWPGTPSLAAAAADASPSTVPAGPASRRPSRRLLIGTVLLVAAVGLVGTGMLATANQLGALLALGSAGDAKSPDTPGAVPPSSDEPLAETAARLLPSVVQIEANGALGSGFVAADGGLILTA